jgi:hypothetical protein
VRWLDDSSRETPLTSVGAFPRSKLTESRHVVQVLDCWRIMDLSRVKIARIHPTRFGAPARSSSPGCQAVYRFRLAWQTGEPFIVRSARLSMNDPMIALHLFPMIAAIACSFLARTALSRRATEASSRLAVSVGAIDDREVRGGRSRTLRCPVTLPSDKSEFGFGRSQLFPRIFCKSANTPCPFSVLSVLLLSAKTPCFADLPAFFAFCRAKTQGFPFR